MTELGHGAVLPGRGVRLRASRPKLLLLGALPALIVFLVLAGSFVALAAVRSATSSSWATPFADDWPDAAAHLARFLLVLAVLVGAVPAVHLGVRRAHPRRRRPVLRADLARDRGRARAVRCPTGEVGFVQSVRDGARLAAMGVVSSVLVLGSGIVPRGRAAAGRGARRPAVGAAARPRAARPGPRAARPRRPPPSRQLLAPYRRRVLGLRRASPSCASSSRSAGCS